MHVHQSVRQRRPGFGSVVVAFDATFGAATFGVAVAFATDDDDGSAAAATPIAEVDPLASHGGDHAGAGAVGAERLRGDPFAMFEGSVTGLPVRASQTRAVPALLAVTTRAPSG